MVEPRTHLKKVVRAENNHSIEKNKCAENKKLETLEKKGDILITRYGVEKYSISMTSPLQNV